MTKLKRHTVLAAAVLCLGGCASSELTTADYVSACAELDESCVENHVIVIVNPQEDASEILDFAAQSRVRHQEYFELGPVKRFAVLEGADYGRQNPFKDPKFGVETAIIPPPVEGFRAFRMPMFTSVRLFMESVQLSSMGADTNAMSIMRFPFWIRDVAHSIQMSPQQQQLAKSDIASTQIDGLVPLDLYFSLDLVKMKSNQDLINWVKQRTMSDDVAFRSLARGTSLTQAHWSQAHQRLDHQSILFRDFMVDLANDKKVFHYIAPNVYEGGSMDHWLATQTDYPSVPKTVDALESRWHQWVSQTL